MLVSDLVKQDFKKSVRSSGFYKSMITKVMYTFLGIYFMSIFLFLGFNLDKILLASGSHDNPLYQMCGAMLYTILTGLAMRFMMQSLSTFNLPPYQVLNIKRGTLVNFLILKPLFNPMNYWTLFVIVPFAIKYIGLYYGALPAISFIWMYVTVIMFNSLTASFLKRKFGPSILHTLIFFAVILGIIALEYFKVFSLYEISKSIFSFIVLSPIGWLATIALVFIGYGLNRWFFSQNYYAETFNKYANKSKAIMTDFAFLNRFGIEGEIMSMELKLILRHKRTKSVLYMSGIFLLYGLLFYPQEIYKNNNGMLFFVAIFLTGLAMLMFGQWLIGWDGSHFDGLMTKNISAKSYIQANFKLISAFCIASFILTAPYFFFGVKIMEMHIAAFLYNIGVNAFVVVFFASYNTKRLDLSKSSAMNYQGVSIKNFLVMIPLLLLPIIIVSILSAIFSLNTALYVISVIGLIGIILNKWLMKLCVNQFQARKYILAEGYRQSE